MTCFFKLVDFIKLEKKAGRERERELESELELL